MIQDGSTGGTCAWIRELGHMRPSARPLSQIRQGRDTSLQQTRHHFHQQGDGDIERIYLLLLGYLHLQPMKHLG